MTPFLECQSGTWVRMRWGKLWWRTGWIHAAPRGASASSRFLPRKVESPAIVASERTQRSTEESSCPFGLTNPPTSLVSFQDLAQPSERRKLRMLWGPHWSCFVRWSDLQWWLSTVFFTFSWYEWSLHISKQLWLMPRQGNQRTEKSKIYKLSANLGCQNMF